MGCGITPQKLLISETSDQKNPSRSQKRVKNENYIEEVILTLALSSALIRTNSFLLWEPAMSRPPVFMSSPPNQKRYFSVAHRPWHDIMDRDCWATITHRFRACSRKTKETKQTESTINVGSGILYIFIVIKIKRKWRDPEGEKKNEFYRVSLTRRQLLIPQQANKGGKKTNSLELSEWFTDSREFYRLTEAMWNQGLRERGMREKRFRHNQDKSCVKNVDSKLRSNEIEIETNVYTKRDVTE